MKNGQNTLKEEKKNVTSRIQGTFLRWYTLWDANATNNISQSYNIWQGNRYVSGTLLFIISAIERGMINWDEWFKVRSHKEMIVV